MKSYICAIGTANPSVLIPQMQVAQFMANALNFDSAETRKLMALYRASGIEQRFSVLDDFNNQNGDYTFFPNTPDLEPFPTVKRRMDAYKQHALQLSVAAINDCLVHIPEVTLSSITHLITVSCTGMYAPGLDIEILEELHLPTTIQRTAINFMGCYAAFNGLKVADAFCKANPLARVLVVCTEICTIHFQKHRETDHLISNALFGDGAAAVLVQARPTESTCLRMESFHCDLVPAGKKEMAWHISDFGFEMTLSSYVPEMIKKGIRQLASNLLANLDVNFTEINLFAIHPGGRKILECIEMELGITRHENRFAYDILKNFGNMSSATVLFVLKALIESVGPEHEGAPVLSFAFGPGLTLESMLLKVQHV
ncbi:type III polyketide synthase [Adhaeribacter aquaticus]|uniref:type III polyketide synthase n=1 Tax=Adhaeribacter aquaticus TaxID=299567 RepID=UPI00047D021A|nr:type III polyketide synthase [Adhaeribacter aquaticus]